jgi:hypothetical protein
MPIMGQILSTASMGESLIKIRILYRARRRVIMLPKDNAILIKIIQPVIIISIAAITIITIIAVAAVR